MKTSFATNLVTGLFLVIVAAATIALLVFFQGYRVSEDGDVYYLVFDTAPKVRTSTPVEVSGRRIGSVEEVMIEQRQGGEAHNYALITQVVLRVRIDAEFRKQLQFYTNSYAEVVPSLFGGSVISINPGGPGAGDPSITGELTTLVPSADPTPGNTIIGIPTSTVNDVMAKADDAAANVAAITAELRDLLTDKETRANLEASIESITQTMQDLSSVMRDKIKPALDEHFLPMVEDLHAMVDESRQMLDTNREKFDAIATNMQTITEHGAKFAEEDMGEMTATLQSVLEQVDTLTKTLNEVMLDNRGNIDSSMSNLRRATQELSAMMTKLRRDPSIALWGTDADDNAADVDPNHERATDEKKLRDRGHLPAQPRDE